MERSIEVNDGWIRVDTGILPVCVTFIKPSGVVALELSPEEVDALIDALKGR